MSNTYKLKKDENGILWVTVNELMHDVKQALTDLSNIDDPRLLPSDKIELDKKILGLHAIYTFLGALQQEQTLLDKAAELQRQPVMGNITIKTLNQQLLKENLH